MFHPPFAYCLWSVVCRAGFGKPDLPSVWPAPGRIRFSGFCLIRVSGSRRWLHLRFPALLVSPVSNLACSSGFRCWLLLRFSSCPSLRFSAYLLLRFPVLSASSVFVLSVSAGFQPCLLLRFPVLAASPVFILSVSAVFSLPAPPVPGVVRFFGFRFVRLCRFSALPAPPVPGFVRLFALTRSSVSSSSALCPPLRHTTGGAAAQSRKPSFTNCSRMRVQSATGRFTPSTNRIGQPRLLSSM